MKEVKTHIECVVDEINQLITQTLSALYRLGLKYDQEIKPPQRHEFTKQPISKDLLEELTSELANRLEKTLKYYRDLADHVKKTKVLFIDMEIPKRDLTAGLKLNRTSGYAAVMRTDGTLTRYTDILSSKINSTSDDFKKQLSILILKLIKALRHDGVNSLTVNGELQDVHYLVLSELIENNHCITELRLDNNKADFSNLYLDNFIKCAMSSKSLTLLSLGVDDNVLLQGGIAHKTIGIPLYGSELKHRLCISMEIDGGVYAWFREDNDIFTAQLFSNTLGSVENIILNSESKELNPIFEYGVPTRVSGINLDESIPISEEEEGVSAEGDGTSQDDPISDIETDHSQQYPVQYGAIFLCALALLGRKVFDLNTKYDEWYAIDYAIMYRNFWCVSYYLLKSATLNTTVGTQTSLHIAAEFSTADILELLLSNPQIKKIIDAPDASERSPVEVAISANQHECVEVLSHHGANPDRSKNGKWLRSAFNQGHFEVVKILMDFNVIIPDEINSDFIKILASADDHPLKQTLLIRSQFFQAIRNGDLEKIRSMLAEGDAKMIHWHNFDNHSALYVSCMARQYRTYGYLHSFGFSNKDNESPDYGDTVEEKKKFKEAALKAYKDSDDVLASYLACLTEARHPNKAVDLKTFYRELISVPCIKPVLEVIEYASPRVDLYLDFGSENVRLLSPTSSESTMGTCDFRLSRIIVGAKRNAKELRGTTAHEFTHLACQVIWLNDCLPYAKTDLEAQDRYNTMFQVIKARHLGGYNFDTDLKNVFTVYSDEEDQKAELIVRVAHIMARDDSDAGTALLNEQVPEVLSYYQDVFLVSCRAFVNRQYQHADNQSRPHIALKKEFDRHQSSRWSWPNISGADVVNYAAKGTLLSFAAYGVWTFFQQQLSDGGQSASSALDSHTISSLNK
jgi:ankyrin repeat protein